MPTHRQIEAQVKKESGFFKQNLVHQVADTALHIIYDSYLYGSNLWPKKGFRAGWGIGCDLKDCIYYGVNAWGWMDENPNGAIVFNFHNTPLNRRWKQITHLKILLDYTIINDIYFEDYLRDATINVVNDQAKFKFTINPTNQ